MLKFKGKPQELREFLSILCDTYGKEQKMIAVCIMMEKENEENRKQML